LWRIYLDLLQQFDCCGIDVWAAGWVVRMLDTFEGKNLFSGGFGGGGRDGRFDAFGRVF
jgi:hypothetical protein